MIREELQIHAPLSRVYETFAELQRWPEILPDTLGVEVLYDDGEHQEFTMTVSRPKGPETVRGVRFLVPLQRIELFQPVPPPGFRKMCGIWDFTETDSVTTVHVSREIELQDPATYDSVAERLRSILRTNLTLFRDYIEGHAAHSH